MYVPAYTSATWLRTMEYGMGRCLSGKLWHLRHNCVGDTTAYH